MHIDRLFVWRSTRTEQGIDKSRQPICLADDDVRVLAQLIVVQLSLQQLRCAANAAQRILYFMGELTNHLASRAMLNQQRIFAADLRSTRYIGYLDEQAGAFDVDWRYTTIDDAFVAMNFGRREPHLVGIVIRCSQDPAQDVAHLRLVINKLQ